MRDRQGGIIGVTVTPTQSSASGVWTLREAERFNRGGIWPARPGAPTSLAGTAGNAQVALTWTAPTSNGGSAITGYVVEYTPSGGSASTVSTGSTSASYTVTGLTNGTAYTFRVAAVNAVGTGSYSTASGSVTPVSFTATAVLLTSGTSYTVPTGATTMKAWAVGGGQGVSDVFGSFGNGAGVAYKTWSVVGQGGATVTYAVGTGGASWKSSLPSNGTDSTITYGGSTITGASAKSQTVGGGYSGGDGGAAGGRGIGVTINGGGFAGGAAGGNTTAVSCGRNPTADVSGMLAAAALAGAKTTEDCGAAAAFGSGGVSTKYGTTLLPGYGGGAGAYAHNGGSGAVLLYFT